MNRCRVSMVAVSLAVCLFGCWLLALPGEASAERYDIVVGGKLTDDARITGTTKPGGDREDDEAFVFSGLHNFVCAGAGFTSPNARIVAKLSIDKFDWTAAGMVVNHHCLGFDMKPDNKLFGAGTAFGKEPKAFANASELVMVIPNQDAWERRRPRPG